jgi:hypothetical protein
MYMLEIPFLSRRITGEQKLSEVFQLEVRLGIK